MHTYLVETHIGNYYTKAKSPRKALANILFRLGYGGDIPWEYDYWLAREVA